MADTKTSAEQAADELTGAELVRIVQSSNNRRTTTQDIANLSGNADVPSASDLIGSNGSNFTAVTVSTGLALSGGNLVTNGRATVYDRGTISSGTQTPEPGDGAAQKAVNNGAHTLAAPTQTGGYILTYTNGASAGAITASGWDLVDDPCAALSHIITDSIIECAAYNDGVAQRLVVTIIVDATP